MKKFITALLTALFIGFCGVIYYYYENQDRYIFRSLPLSKEHQFTWEAPFEEVYLPVSHSGQIHGVYFKQKNSKGVVLFLHGNSRNLDFHGKRFVFFAELGYDFFAIDYRGFGKSSPGFKEEWFFEDSMAAYAFLKEHYPEEKIHVFGHSLGTSAATYVAAHNHPANLVLEAPFYSMIAAAIHTKPFLPEWVVSLILKYPLRTDIWIERVSCPIYIFHGTHDVVVPLAQGERLYNKVKDSKDATLFILNDHGHEHLQKHEAYQTNIKKILP
jgi:pimeloyl-ACP methyl ester carboxylesterase